MVSVLITIGEKRKKEKKGNRQTECGKKEVGNEERKQIQRVGRKKRNGETGKAKRRQNRQQTFKSLKREKKKQEGDKKNTEEKIEKERIKSIVIGKHKKEPRKEAKNITLYTLQCLEFQCSLSQRTPFHR